MTTTKPSVSSTQNAAVRSRFSTTIAETANSNSVAPLMPARKAFSRSPYREKTVMMRVPMSLAKEFRARLEKYKQAVAAGDHDNWE